MSNCLIKNYWYIFLIYIFVMLYLCYKGYKYFDNAEKEINSILSKADNKPAILAKTYYEVFYKGIQEDTYQSFEFLKELTALAIRALFLINGGGASGIAVYLGNNSHLARESYRAFGFALGSFAFGAFLTLLCLGASYFAQTYYTHSLDLQRGAIISQFFCNNENNQPNPIYDNKVIWDSYRRAGNREGEYGNKIHKLALGFASAAIVFAGFGILTVMITLVN